MEIRFDRDLRHNYMVLCGLKTGEDYRLRMLAENSPQGLLRCSLRNINGGGYLYYEIDSKQQFGNRFAEGRLGAEDLKRFLRSVISLTEGLEDYLLDIERVLFSTDCIYVDIRTGDFYFVYCPFSEEEEDTLQKTGAFSVFSEDMLSCLDPDDEEAARIAYLLCELASSTEMLIRDMAEAALAEAEKKTDPVTEEEGFVPSQEPVVFRQSAERVDTENIRTDTLGEPPGSGREKDVVLTLDDGEDEEEGKAEGRGRGRLLLMALFAAVFVSNLYIRWSYNLSAQENILSLAAAGVSAVAAAITGVSLLTGDARKNARQSGAALSSGGDGGRKQRRRKKKKIEDGEEDEWILPRFEEAELIGGSGVTGNIGRPEGASRANRAGSVVLPNRSGMRREEESDDETTVLTDESFPHTSKLYGRNGAETVNIPLEHLPLTVGKLSGCADFVIRHPSISRMHAKFTGDGTGAVTRMKDLNSTNGTFLNGRRLRPNEIVDIRSGDEIGLGHLVFELR